MGEGCPFLRGKRVTLLGLHAVAVRNWETAVLSREKFPAPKFFGHLSSAAL